MNRCPTCNSNAPHMHPAIQHGGEVEVCADAFHLRETPENRPEYISAVRAKQASASEAPMTDDPIDQCVGCGKPLTEVDVAYSYIEERGAQT